jgi:aminotransferase EvaB
MSIRVWEYLAEYADEREDVLAAVDRVFSSGTLILGESVKNFEIEFASFCKSADAVGVDNATNGLFLALKALDIGPGDEVITVSNTAVPTVSAIEKAGAITKFVDIEPVSCLMDVSQLEKVITSKTKAVIPVHLYGQCVDMTSLMKICTSKKIHVIEDCSQSHGATHQGQPCGSIGDLGVFSFYPTKPLGGFGDGGMITCSSNFLADRLRSLRFYGMKDTYYAEEQGYNSRLDEVHAEILRFKLGRFWDYIDRRRKIAARYTSALVGTNLTLPSINKDNSHVYYVYVARHVNRDQIISALKKSDIHLNISYPFPIHLMRGYAHLGGKVGDFPETEKAAKEIFSLPMFPSLSEQNQDLVCAALKDIPEIIT